VWAEASFSAPLLLHKGTVGQPRDVKMFSQGVMSSEEANNNPKAVRIGNGKLVGRCKHRG